MKKRGLKRVLERGQKRGQVTVFVILGLALLIGALIYFYITTRDIRPNVNVPRLGGDAGQVQEFVEGCIDQIGRTGLTELGRHGGYIDPTDMR